MQRLIISIAALLFSFVQLTFSFETNEKGKYTLLSKIGSDSQVLRVENDVVAVQVRTEARLVDGSYTWNKGLFNIGTTNNRALLCAFPEEPWSSHFNINIDDTVYSDDPYPTNTVLLPINTDPRIVGENTISCSWETQNIFIEQRLTPEQYSDSSGAILIEYVITNTDDVPHDIGLLLLMDTMIDTNDSAPLATSFSYSEIEQKWKVPFIPAYFRAFETNPSYPGLVAQGTLVGGQAIQPDVFITGDWKTLYRVAWDFTPTGTYYRDSAVILRWNQEPLQQGEQRTYSTYYGIVHVTPSDNGDLSLAFKAPSQLTCDEGEVTPNSFDVNLIVTNNDSSTAEDVQATLQLPEGLTFSTGVTATQSVSPTHIHPQESGTASWSVLAQPTTEDVLLTVTVEVTSTTTESNSKSLTILIPHCESEGDLSPTLTASSQLTCYKGEVIPNPFDVNLIVTNNGSLTTEDVQATLQLPEGLTFSSGVTATQSVSPTHIHPQESGTASWSVLAQPTTENVLLAVTVEVTSTNAKSNSKSLTILIPHCESEGDLSPTLTASSQLTCDEGKVNPNPFEVNLIVTNDGSSTAEDVQARLQLPEGLTFSTGVTATQSVSPLHINPGESGTASWSVLVHPTTDDVLLTMTVEVTSINAESKSRTLTVFVPSCMIAPDFTVHVDPSSRIIAPGGDADFTITLETQGEFNSPVSLDISPPREFFQWTFLPNTISPGDSSDLILETDPTVATGSYSFYVSGTSGDTVRSDTIKVTVEAKVVTRPNPFTPNQDGYNDEVSFSFEGMDLESPSLKIFNMNGREIISFDQPTGSAFNWDGRDEDGDEQRPGVYLYLLQDGSKEIASGTIVLAR